MVTPVKRPAIYSPTPPSIITCLNAPPPPVIKIKRPIALMDAPADAVKSFIGIFLAIPIVYIANISEINKATGAFPINRMTWINRLSAKPNCFWKISKNAAANIKTIGNTAVKTLTPNPGVSSNFHGF